MLVTMYKSTLPKIPGNFSNLHDHCEKLKFRIRCRVVSCIWSDRATLIGYSQACERTEKGRKTICLERKRDICFLHRYVHVFASFKNWQRCPIPSVESWYGGSTSIGIRKLTKCSRPKRQKFGEGVDAKYKTSVTFTFIVSLFDITLLPQMRFRERDTGTSYMSMPCALQPRSAVAVQHTVTVSADHTAAVAAFTTQQIARVTADHTPTLAAFTTQQFVWVTADHIRYQGWGSRKLRGCLVRLRSWENVCKLTSHAFRWLYQKSWLNIARFFLFSKSFLISLL
jgi:hypothetical protein